MIELNYRDPRPIYEQVRSSFLNLIASGALAPGEKLPSVRELAVKLAINPNTIQRAYRELDAAGVTCTIPGKGSFVAEGGDALRAKKEELLRVFDGAAAELMALGVGAAELAGRIREEKA